jgi:hypothetical protein
MSTILKVFFMMAVCLTASEIQAYSTQSILPSQATHAALANFEDAGADGGTWIMAAMRFLSGNGAVTVMWFFILAFGIALFWSEITSLSRMCSCCSSKDN